jgi:benzoate-CoA ligase family protein
MAGERVIAMSEPMNAAVYLVDRQIERGHGDRVAVAGPSGSLTYAELGRQVAAASAGWHSAGLRPEERVLLYACDRCDTLVALLSVMRCGAVPVPVSTLYSGPDLAARLRDARARFLIVSPEHARDAQAAVDEASAVADLRGVVALDDADLEPPDHIARLVWERDVLNSGADAQPPDRTVEDSPALWLYTSGTTGTPKAAMHRHGSIRFVAEAYGQDVLGIGPADSCFSAAKLSFAYGLGNSCFLPLSAGATTVLDPAPAGPETLLRRLVADKPTVFFGVPSLYAAMLRAEDAPADAFGSVRLAVTAGEPLPTALQRGFQERFGVDLVNGLGSTETLHIFLSNRPGQARPGSTGTVVPGYEARIMAEDGSLAERGQPGELQVKAPSSAIGYWTRTQANKTVFQGEWLSTGDLFTCEEDGYYTCLGRTTEMIKSGGLWVSPAEVEARLLEHPTVAEVAVVAVPDSDGLDKPVACVVPSPGSQIAAEELIAFCREELASFKRPRHVLTFEALPTNPTGKVEREELRGTAIDLLQSGSAGQDPAPAKNTADRVRIPEAPPALAEPPGPLDLMFYQAAEAPSDREASANVATVLHLRGAAPEVTELRHHVAARIEGLPCLTHFLTGTGDAVHWDSTAPDLDVHVVEESLPEGDEHLDTAVERLRRTVLPSDAPSWRLWLLHGHAPGRYALFYLSQHDVQDAGNIVTVLEGLFGKEIEPNSSSAVVPSLADAPPSAAPDFLGTLDEVVRCARAHGIWTCPDHPLSGRRAVHWLEVPTDLFSAIGRTLGGSANDVHLAALGHAVAAWAGEHWPAADGPPLPIMVPLNLRDRDELGRPGNRFFLSRVDVPGGPSTPLQRLARTIGVTAPLKSSSHRAALRRALDALPRPLLDLVTAACTTPEHLSIVGSIFSLRHPLSFGDAPVDRITPLICCPDGFPATVALFLYEQVSIACFHIDRALPGADTIPARWRTALDEMAGALVHAGQQE